MRSTAKIGADLWKKIIGQKLALFLDLDGTLAPIADRYDLAVLPPKTRVLLNQLAGRPGCRLTIISGRSSRELRKMVGLKKVLYIGNHGLEMGGAAGSKPEQLVSLRQLKMLKMLNGILREKLKPFRGVLLQYKKLTLSVHYRLARRPDFRKIKNIVFEAWASLQPKKDLTVGGGKKVWEIKPAVDWNKGRAVGWLLKQKQFRGYFPVYLGDDLTDEDAFRAIKKYGLTILVGRPRDSAAAYYLPDTRAAAGFLRKILSAKRTRRWPN